VTLASIPEPDGSFDAAMRIEALEHVPYPVQSLGELAHLLHVGGYLVVMAPFAALTHCSPYFYQTGYNRYFYEYWLDQFNFEILDLHCNGNYFGYLAQEVRRIHQVANDYAKSQAGKSGRYIIDRMLGLLNKLSAYADDSKDFLRFGFHVLAKNKTGCEHGKAV